MDNRTDLPRYVKVSSAGLLLPRDAADWDAVYIPAAELTVARRLLPGKFTWSASQKACAELTLCGFTNWQAISRREFLNHLVLDDRYTPCTDSEFFTFEDSSAWIWTRDVPPWDPSGDAWRVSLGGGLAGPWPQSAHACALACRPGQLSSALGVAA